MDDLPKVTVDKPITNILVLGKTGVGKTSLINYLFGLNLPVGAGLPVTERGLHEQTVDQNGIEFHVFDSWGIEADRMSSWQQEVLTEIGRRNRSPRIMDWFHAIYYCFSANSARIEAAEVENILVPLVTKGYRVMIILTHADAGFQKAAKLKGMRDYLLTTLRRVQPDFQESDIINIASLEGVTLAGDKLERFGKEQVLAVSLRNLSTAIARRLPEFYKSNVQAKLAGWRERSLIFVAHANIGFFFNNKDARNLIKDLNLDLNNTFGAIDADAGRAEKEAALYLATLAAAGFIKGPVNTGTMPLQLAKYDFTHGNFQVQMDFWGGFVKSNRTIRKELTARVEKTYQEILHSLEKRRAGYTDSLLAALGKLLGF